MILYNCRTPSTLLWNHLYELFYLIHISFGVFIGLSTDICLHGIITEILDIPFDQYDTEYDLQILS